MVPDCFADEIAIDFPSVGHVVERMRDAFLGERADDGVVRAELQLSAREARRGVVTLVDVPVRDLCGCCGGRGETWTEPCLDCDGTGASLSTRRIRVSVPPGIADGTRLRLRFTPPDAASVRVEVRIGIKKSGNWVIG
jgi:hypothetical protein